MKKILSLIICILLMIPMSFSAFAEKEPEAVIWEYDSGTLTISGKGKTGDYASVTDAPWHSLFADVTKLVVSEGITQIGAYSFSMMTALKEVSLPSGLTAIGNNAFERCYSLKKISLPNETEVIGEKAFLSCTALKELSYTRKSQLKYIGKYAFAGCSSLANTSLPQRMKEIGYGAFSGCVALAEMALPFSLEKIGECAFESCISLKKINIPWQVTAVPDFCFLGCRALEDVDFSIYLESVGTEAFLSCTSLKYVYLPEAVTHIGEDAFGMSYFEREYIPYDTDIASASSAASEYAARYDNITFYSDDASHVCSHVCPWCGKCTDPSCRYYSCYEKCEGHEFPITGECGENVCWYLYEDGKLVIDGEGRTRDYSYYESPFYPARRMISAVEVKEGVSTVGTNAFFGLENLTGAKLPSTLISLGRGAFKDCASLSDIKIPDGVDVIERYTFENCSSLSEVLLPKALSEIKEFAFGNCRTLPHIDLPEGPLTVRDYAFENCTKLLSVVLRPDTEAERYAFGYTFTNDRKLLPLDGFMFIGYSLEYNSEDEREETYPSLFFESDAGENFSDVPEGNDYFSQILRAREKGLVIGVGENRFEPERNITKGEFLLIVTRALGSADSGSGAAGESYFPNPKEDITPLQAAEIIKRAFSLDVAASLGKGTSLRRDEACGIIVNLLGY